jgi:hypothetical protein
MPSFTKYLAAAAAIGAFAVPAAAQTAYPYNYQQTYPQQSYPGYSQPAYGQSYGYTQPYGYNQSYGQTYGQGYAQNPITAIIDSLLGNRYNVTDRQAVSQCATAAMAQASAQYGGYGYNSRYGGQYAQPNGYGTASNMRVTSITDVQRRSGGLRVKGMISSGYGGQYGQYSQYGYQNRGYGAQQLSFRCNVAYNGAVTGVRVSPSSEYRRY